MSIGTAGLVVGFLIVVLLGLVAFALLRRPGHATHVVGPRSERQ